MGEGCAYAIQITALLDFTDELSCPRSQINIYTSLTWKYICWVFVFSYYFSIFIPQQCLSRVPMYLLSCCISERDGCGFDSHQGPRGFWTGTRVSFHSAKTCGSDSVAKCNGEYWGLFVAINWLPVLGVTPTLQWHRPAFGHLWRQQVILFIAWQKTALHLHLPFIIY